jgi:hypothetical protein
LFIPIIVALGRQKQEDHEFEPSLDYIGRTCLKKERKTKKNRRKKEKNKQKGFL